VLYFFVRGLKPGAFATQLAGDKPTSMDDLKVRRMGEGPGSQKGGQSKNYSSKPISG
jgi:hypothetical protein